MKNTSIPRPSPAQVEHYLKLWDSLENYTMQESSLRKLYTKTYPLNKKMDDVLIKVCALNDLYNTNIFSSFTVAKHIVDLKIDKYLSKNDTDIVNKIAKVRMSNGSTKNFYSFATKYCSHHKPTDYPIYDSYVERFLMFHKRKDNFCIFNKEDLKIFSKYKRILEEFRKFYGLNKYNLKLIDKYLWQAGKKYFPKKY